MNILIRKNDFEGKFLPNDKLFHKKWKFFFSKNNLKSVDLTYGVTQEKHICLNCQQKKYLVKVFPHLILSEIPENFQEITDLFNYNEEFIDEPCENCQNVNFVNKRRLKRIPKILFVKLEGIIHSPMDVTEKLRFRFFSIKKDEQGFISKKNKDSSKN